MGHRPRPRVIAAFATTLIFITLASPMPVSTSTPQHNSITQTGQYISSTAFIVSEVVSQ